VQAFDTTDAHGRYQDKLTDQAGSFPSGAAARANEFNAERTGLTPGNPIGRHFAHNLPTALRNSPNAKAGKVVFRRAGINSFCRRGAASAAVSR